VGKPCGYDHGLDGDRFGETIRVVAGNRRVNAAPEQERKPAAAANLQCPICRSERFLDFNGRSNARCASCLSVERNRLLWMILDRFEIFRPGIRVFHVAPELPFIRRFSELLGEDYHACDFDPGRYASRYTTVRPIDLCIDLVKLPSRSFDLILHSHVLEHVRCNPKDVLGELERLLAPGGHHFLSVPVIGAYTREDMSDSPTPEERAKRFGQSDHYRVFGSIDFHEVLDSVWGKREKHNIEPRELFSAEELERAAIAPEAWSGLSSHTVFHHVRSERRTISTAIAQASHDHPAPPAAREVLAEKIPVRRIRPPHLVLHIGMPTPDANLLQQWFTANRYGALRNGLDYWPIADSHSEAMFYAFASPSRVAGGGDLPDNGSREVPPGFYRERLSEFLSNLDGRTGVVSAEILWSFVRDEISNIVEFLRRAAVDTRIVCCICSPEHLAASIVRRRCRTSLALSDFGLPLAGAIPVDYRRLDRWTFHFGAENVDVVPFVDIIESFRNFLHMIGVVPPPATFIKKPAEMSLTGVKALLSLTQYLKSQAGESKKRSRRLRELLMAMPGDAFAFPETVLARMTPAFQREVQYLTDKFGIASDLFLHDCEAVDDARFFRWEASDVVALLGAINDFVAKAEEAASDANNDA
jgi:SAM-dependent methyltransferase